MFGNNKKLNISFCGAGKLGLPVALACEAKGHNVMVYDVNPKVAEILATKQLPYLEAGAQELLNNTHIRYTSLEEIVSHGELIFVPIQTPHNPKFEGTTCMPEERVDFDYSYLKAGIKALADEIAKQGEEKIVIIISTVLPGTVEREIKPLLNDKVKLCYNPFFIAMGQTISDFLNPEFVLFGVDDKSAAIAAKAFYATIHSKPVYETTIKAAELIKVAYNTYIGQKIVFANNLMEICHKLGINVDDVTDALKLATDRLISPKYMSAGMGDGGGCHPRDGIAMSWLAKQLNLSYDWSEAVMLAREKQTAWLADLVQLSCAELKIWILGTAYKPNTNLTIGSPSLLLKNMLLERGLNVGTYDPYVDLEFDPPFAKPALFFIGTKHDVFKKYKFPKGSIVIDPWRYIKKQRGVKLLPIGGIGK